MAEKIANPVRYDPQRDAFCCEGKWFGIRYQKRFTRADDALLFVRENSASCPGLAPYGQQLNDYHYGHWARQLEEVQRTPRNLTWSCRGSWSRGC